MTLMGWWCPEHGKSTCCYVTFDGHGFLGVAGVAKEVVEEEYGGDEGGRENGVKRLIRPFGNAIVRPSTQQQGH